MSKKAEDAVRAKLKDAGDMIRVGSDIHLMEMLLTEIERLRQTIIDARDYVEHKDICEGRIADWKLGATCTCGGDAILAKINAALSV